LGADAFTEVLYAPGRLAVIVPLAGVEETSLARQTFEEGGIWTGIHNFEEEGDIDGLNCWDVNRLGNLRGSIGGRVRLTGILVKLSNLSTC